MAYRNHFNDYKVPVDEELRITIERSLREFMEDDERREHPFPPTLSNEERKWIHQLAPTFGIVTRSQGHGKDRFLTMYKKDLGVEIITKPLLQIHQPSALEILTLLKRNPLTESEKKALTPLDELTSQASSSQMFNMRQEIKSFRPMFTNPHTGCLTSVLPQIPPPAIPSPQMDAFRSSLPIANMQARILQEIDRHQVVLISGDTGCGKTTQVPQYILESCHLQNRKCRIIVAEPRRLAALSVAERVAAERSEDVGKTVGYQIRLESKVSIHTLLTYCTNGILLRTLMADSNPETRPCDTSFQNVTHVIVDEVHERDRFSDLLLTVLKDALHTFPNMRVIIMSATFDTQRFVEFFGSCPVVTIPGNVYDVKSNFLEDILQETGYRATEIKLWQTKQTWKPQMVRNLVDMCQPLKDTSILPEVKKEELQSPVGMEQDTSQISEDVAQMVSNSLKNVWSSGTRESGEQLLSLYINEDVPVDYQEKETGMTALIAVTARGFIDYVEEFLHMGANVHLRTPLNDFDALEWAKYFKHVEIYELLLAYADVRAQEAQKEADEVVISKQLTVEQKKLLEAYHRSFDDEDVDLNLILCLIHHICYNSPKEKPKGAILIFLPRYDEIVNLRQMILADRDFGTNKYVVYALHSQMQSSDQKRVFKRVPEDVRKIILSTNIAETSITIDDVVYVIDSGKVKEKSYDALLGVSMMKSVWISQANVVQRKGRAGRCRPGVAYHLYSNHRFQNMSKFQVPEILRMPVHEICLHVKLLAPKRSLVDFLTKMPDSPSATLIKDSVHLLKSIDAFDAWERITEVGIHLLDLPVDPNLGKMILYAVVLKCLDPVLTIVCTLAYREPFVIPLDPRNKKEANDVKMGMSEGTMSDYLVFIRAYHGWQAAQSNRREREFCQKYYINPSVMETIHGTRQLLLGQLRASGFVRARGNFDMKDLNVNSDNWGLVKASLTAGCYPNIIHVERSKLSLTTRKEKGIRFHPSSVMNLEFPVRGQKKQQENLDKIPSDWFIYGEMARLGRVSHAKSVSIVSPLTVALFAGPARNQRTASGTSLESLDVDEWISFKLDKETKLLVSQLRHKWHALFLRRMENPGRAACPQDDSVIRTLAHVLLVEEESLGLEIPKGIGQRPVPMAPNSCAPFTNANLNSPIHRPTAFKNIIKGPPVGSGASGGYPSQRIRAIRGNPSGGGVPNLPFQQYGAPSASNYKTFNERQDNYYRHF